jgi:hypothetical protein
MRLQPPEETICNSSARHGAGDDGAGDDGQKTSMRWLPDQPAGEEKPRSLATRLPRRPYFRRMSSIQTAPPAMNRLTTCVLPGARRPLKPVVQSKVHGMPGSRSVC